MPGLIGTRNAVQLFARLYRRESGTLLEALSAALTPEADLGIDARVEAAEGDFVRFLLRVCNSPEITITNAFAVPEVPGPRTYSRVSSCRRRHLLLQESNSAAEALKARRERRICRVLPDLPALWFPQPWRRRRNTPSLHSRRAHRRRPHSRSPPCGGRRPSPTWLPAWRVTPRCGCSPSSTQFCSSDVLAACPALQAFWAAVRRDPQSNRMLIPAAVDSRSRGAPIIYPAVAESDIHSCSVASSAFKIPERCCRCGASQWVPWQLLRWPPAQNRSVQSWSPLS